MVPVALIRKLLGVNMKLSGLFQTRSEMPDAIPNSYEVTRLISYLGSGFYYLAVSPDGGAYVLRKINGKRFAIFQVSSADLLAMQPDDCYRPESAKLILVETSKAGCLEAFARMLAK